MLTQVMAVNVWKASPFQFGLMEACIPLGYMIGSGLIMILGSRIRRRGLFIMSGLFCLGPMYILLSFITSAATAIPVVLLIGFMFSFCTLLINIILRLEISEEIQGRVFGVLGSIMSVAPSIGLTLVSYLSDFSVRVRSWVPLVCCCSCSPYMLPPGSRSFEVINKAAILRSRSPPQLPSCHS